MVSSAFHPLNIFIVGLGGAFLIPLVKLPAPPWAIGAIVVSSAKTEAANKLRSGMPALSPVGGTIYWIDSWRAIRTFLPHHTPQRAFRLFQGFRVNGTVGSRRRRKP
jgi:hypothetical protein